MPAPAVFSPSSMRGRFALLLALATGACAPTWSGREIAEINDLRDALDRRFAASDGKDVPVCAPDDRAACQEACESANRPSCKHLARLIAERDPEQAHAIAWNLCSEGDLEACKLGGEVGRRHSYWSSETERMYWRAVLAERDGKGVAVCQPGDGAGCRKACEMGERRSCSALAATLWKESTAWKCGQDPNCRAGLKWVQRAGTDVEWQAWDLTQPWEGVKHDRRYFVSFGDRAPTAFAIAEGLCAVDYWDGCRTLAELQAVWTGENPLPTLKRLCDAGYGAYCHLLGEDLLYGQISDAAGLPQPTPDPAAANLLYERACRTGHPASCKAVGAYQRARAKEAERDRAAAATGTYSSGFSYTYTGGADATGAPPKPTAPSADQTRTWFAYYDVEQLFSLLHRQEDRYRDNMHHKCWEIDAPATWGAGDLVSLMMIMAKRDHGVTLAPEMVRVMPQYVEYATPSLPRELIFIGDWEPRCKGFPKKLSRDEATQIASGR